MKLFRTSVITATRRSCAHTGKSVLGNIPTCRAASVTSSFVKRALTLHRVALFAPEVKLARDAGTRFVSPASRVKTSILFSALPATANGAKAVAPLPKYPIVQMENVTPHCAMTARKEDPRSAALASTYSATSAVHTAENATIFTARRALLWTLECTNAPLTGNLMRRFLVGLGRSSIIWGNNEQFLSCT
jgi:hypothetical protein